MTDQKKEEPIIELTEVVEEGPGPAVGQWMETTPPPSPEKKVVDPPRIETKENSLIPKDLKAIPESPLRKFLLAREEPSPSVGPPTAGKSPGLSAPGSQPPRPVSESSRPALDSLRMESRGPQTASEPPHSSPLNSEVEMRALREAMLARVEKWVAQEGVQVVERVAREIFPKIAEDMIRKEIEKLKAEAEEKE